MVIIKIMGHLAAAIYDSGDISGRRIGVGPIEQMAAAPDRLESLQQLGIGAIVVMGDHRVPEIDPADLAFGTVVREAGDEFSAVIVDVAQPALPLS